MHGETRVHHRREEVGVVNGLIIVRIQSLEHLHGFVIGDAKLRRHDLLQLHQRDRALAIRIQRYEVIPDLVALLPRKRPRHHLHAATPELRRPAEIPQSFEDAVVDLDRGLRASLDDPWMLESLLGCEASTRVHLQQRLHEGEPARGHGIPSFLLEQVLAGCNVFRLLLLAACERHIAGKQNKGDDSQTPHVALRSVAPL
mmetsp:Transcript_24720/g.70901  ORF Transcript_24720/g.70901 Transcript_24720/m.70901 type:complete len:200 (-) Transcript_24720:91-690(-)